MHHDPRPPHEPHYREIPEYGYRSTLEEEEFGLIKLCHIAWDERFFIGKVTGGFLVLGVLIALFSPVEYSTSATLMPESQSSQGRAGSLIQRYGGVLGISGGTGSTTGSIPPKLYPEIVQSLPYQIELMSTKVKFTKFDTTATPHTFLTDIYSPFSLAGTIKGYTIGLPGKIIGVFKEEDKGKATSPIVKEVNRNELLSLSSEQMSTIDMLRERLSVSVEDKTGLMKLEFKFPDPHAAAEISKAGIQLLKEHVKEYRTQKARQNLEFVREQVADAKKRFEKAQARLAEFRDSNINLATAKAQAREQELQSRYDLAFNLYNSLSQRLEKAKLELQKETPVLSVLQPVNVPLSNSEPNIKFILMASLLCGAFASMGWIMVRNWWMGARGSW